MEQNPDTLGYKVLPREKGKSADELLQKALQKVCDIIINLELLLEQLMTPSIVGQR